MALNPNMTQVLPFCLPLNTSSSNYQVCAVFLQLSYTLFSLAREIFFPNHFHPFKFSQIQSQCQCQTQSKTQKICSFKDIQKKYLLFPHEANIAALPMQCTVSSSLLYLLPFR